MEKKKKRFSIKKSQKMKIIIQKNPNKHKNKSWLQWEINYIETSLEC